MNQRIFGKTGRAAELAPLSEEQMQAVTAVYDRYLRESIHPQW